MFNMRFSEVKNKVRVTFIVYNVFLTLKISMSFFCQFVHYNAHVNTKHNTIKQEKNQQNKTYEKMKILKRLAVWRLIPRKTGGDG